MKLNLDKDKRDAFGGQSGKRHGDRGSGRELSAPSAIEIGFNARYLLDITGQIEGKEVRFLLAGCRLAHADRRRRGRAHALRPHADAGLIILTQTALAMDDAQARPGASCARVDADLRWSISAPMPRPS